MSPAAERDTIRTFITTVTAVEAIGRRMVQVTCGGHDLHDFDPLGPDTFVYVLAPPEARAELTVDRSFTWSAYDEMPPAERPVGAYYTVRRCRPERAEVDLVVVTHGDDGEGSRWAQRVRPGDPVALWGPREVFDPPAGTDRYLLVGDETGLPAIAAILEHLGPAVRADVVIEVDVPADRLPVVTGDDVTVNWLYREGAPAGTTSLLLDAVTNLVVADTTYAWGGAESHTMTAVRRHLRDQVGLSHDAVAMTGYWRRHQCADDDLTP